MALKTRNRFGQFVSGVSGNPQGRLPRQTESAYLEVTMETVSVEDWAEVVAQALKDALDPESNAHVRARAREWLAKYLIGEPSQLMQLMYREDRNYNIVVTFGDDGSKALPEVIEDVIDVESVVIHDHD